MEEKKPKLGLVTRIKRAVAAEVSLSEKEIDDFMWEFELALLEADVAQPVAEEIISLLKQRLAATKFSRGSDVRTVIESAVRDTIREIVSVPSFDLVEKAKKSEKPFVVMFLGPNGAGKTTTLAKIAHMLKENNLSSIFAASDTFRAASIEQLQYHADALGIKMVKHTYGADPAAVAFDTIKSAKARGIDCVLIDTAGRQETNKNLMEELKKIKRVANPHLLIYLDEALAGNALLERVEQFKAEIGVDGVILSKMDMDVKGGGVISIARSTGVPIIYYGIGQSYRDLVRFSADDLLDRIFG
ncbi:MAG: signal recognition particle-docking protein FtsY [Candidatus Diapherotrites archaeon]|nr:signal recognition particle-docking protein FtsY [Candidatus Diapherotrites archaeon]